MHDAISCYGKPMPSTFLSFPLSASSRHHEVEVLENEQSKLARCLAPQHLSLDHVCLLGLPFSVVVSDATTLLNICLHSWT